MSLFKRLIQPIAKPVIDDAADLRRYVGLVTLLGIAVALSFDVVNQLTFFESWAVAVRSWVLTILVATATAAPISLLVGRSQRDLLRATRNMEQLSLTDVLTGLPNRRALMEAAEQSEPFMVALVIVDVDHFKTVNDSFGHRVGDSVLRSVGHIMQAMMAGSSIMGRLGGEEFAVLGTADAVGRILSELEEFRNRMASTPLLVDGLLMTVTISAGVAIRKPDNSFDRLYADADAALYAAKRNGRNRIELAPMLREHEAYAHFFASKAA